MFHNFFNRLEISIEFLDTQTEKKNCFLPHINTLCILWSQNRNRRLKNPFIIVSLELELCIQILSKSPNHCTLMGSSVWSAGSPSTQVVEGLSVWEFAFYGKSLLCTLSLRVPNVVQCSPIEKPIKRPTGWRIERSCCEAPKLDCFSTVTALLALGANTNSAMHKSRNKNKKIEFLISASTSLLPCSSFFPLFLLVLFYIHTYIILLCFYNFLSFFPLHILILLLLSSNSPQS